MYINACTVAAQMGAITFIHTLSSFPLAIAGPSALAGFPHAPVLKGWIPPVEKIKKNIANPINIGGRSIPMAFPLFGSNAVPYATIKRKKLPTNSIANALLSGASPQLNPPIYSGETKELVSFILSAIRTIYEAEIDAEN